MEGMNIQWDCYVEGDVTMIKTKKTEMKVVGQQLRSEKFEGHFAQIPTMDIPTMGIPAGIPSMSIPKMGQKESDSSGSAKRSPRFVEELEDQVVRTASIATLSVVIDATPEADIFWYKDGDRILDSGKMISLWK